MDKIYKALADNNRRKILKLLNSNNLDVSTLGKYFSITQATLSSHLAVLRKAKLVEAEVRGKQRIYRLQKNQLWRVAEDLGIVRTGGSSGRRVNLVV